MGLWNAGKEVFGHEYFATYNAEYVRQCAMVAGVDLDGFTSSSIVDKPAEEEEAGGTQPLSGFDAPYSKSL